ncbi:MAG: hypothetical protein ABMA64_12245 [Myxococcota bacterium]
MFAVGCTAAKAQLQIVSAEQGLRLAADHEAERIAAFEYEMARLYLEKSKEEAGYSEFRVADALARQSAEWSDRAIIFVERFGRSEVEMSDFSEQGPPPAPNPTAILPDPEPAPDLELDDEVEIPK